MAKDRRGGRISQADGLGSLLASVLMLWIVVFKSVGATQGQTLDDLATPGPDLPTYGHSAFDAVLVDAPGSSDQALRVPYPFSALLARIRAQLQRADTPGTLGTLGTLGTELFDSVLIPLGRSLQRNAAAPDYFRSPRLVVAVRGEAAVPGPPLLKDRLYLGYQPQSGVIEVISYNEAMGRFEFQIVKDYREHATPHVYYAPRMICMACHQNQAPIFSRPLWRETNANPQVAAELLKLAPRFQTLPVNRDIDVPAALDAATDRANRFALSQQLWRDGCGLLQSARNCRATLLNAMLQLRLSGGRGFADDGPLGLNELRKAWQARWPRGLSLPNPDLPDRDPLAADAGATAREVRVAARVDPLVPRDSVETVRFDAAVSMTTVVAGLAEFLAEADVAHLDKLLATSSADPDTESYAADCQIHSKNGTEGARRVDIACATAAGETTVLELQARLYFEHEQYQRGVIDRLRLQQESFADLELHADAGMGNKQGLYLRPHWQHRTLRRSNGNRVAALHLAGVETALAAGSGPGALRLQERADYAPLSRLLRNASKDDDAVLSSGLSDQPLRGSTLTEPLFAALAKRPPTASVAVPRAMPAPRLEYQPRSELARSLDEARPDTTAAQALGTLRRYCAACHDSAETFPPNFLSGDLTAVETKLRQCAERINFRLAMWSLEPEDRAKTPMPPEAALHLLGRAPAEWQTGLALQRLREYIQGLDAGPAVDLTRSGNSYEQLRSCLPTGG